MTAWRSSRVSTATVMVVLVAVGAVGCATNRVSVGATEFAVTGVVLAGPTCPVEKDPPDSACADRPVAAAVVVITTTGGKQVGEVHADPTGHFTIQLRAGDYTFTPQPVDGILGTPSPQVVTVGPAGAQLRFDYDTGIR